MPEGFTYPLHPAPEVLVCPEAGALGSALFRAETIAVPASLLPHLWSFDWVPQYPVVIFTGKNFGWLTNADRDLVWSRWGVPVFEQRVDATGRVNARECEAHDGLHVLEGESWVGELLLSSRCACGLEGKRIACSEMGTDDSLNVSHEMAA